MLVNVSIKAEAGLNDKSDPSHVVGLNSFSKKKSKLP